MCLSLLFGLFFVFGNGCYTQCYRTEMSYVMLSEDLGVEENMCVCFA